MFTIAHYLSKEKHDARMELSQNLGYSTSIDDDTLIYGPFISFYQETSIGPCSFVNHGTGHGFCFHQSSTSSTSSRCPDEPPEVLIVDNASVCSWALRWEALPYCEATIITIRKEKSEEPALCLETRLSKGSESMVSVLDSRSFHLIFTNLHLERLKLRFDLPFEPSIH